MFTFFVFDYFFKKYFAFFLFNIFYFIFYFYILLFTLLICSPRSTNFAEGYHNLLSVSRHPTPGEFLHVMRRELRSHTHFNYYFFSLKLFIGPGDYDQPEILTTGDFGLGDFDPAGDFDRPEILAARRF